MIVYKDKLLKKSSNRKLKLVLSTLDRRWSLYGFHMPHFICYQFSYKLWLQSIQNHTRRRFQAFAPHHLKSLCSVCCSIRIWAGALSSDRLEMLCVCAGNCALPSNQPKLCRSAAPLILLSKTWIVFWNSLRKLSLDDLQGLELGLRLELCPLTNGL